MSFLFMRHTPAHNAIVMSIVSFFSIFSYSWSLIPYTLFLDALITWILESDSLGIEHNSYFLSISIAILICIFVSILF